MWGPQMPQKLLSQSEKVTKCNFKSKAQLHEKLFFLMKLTVFCNAEDRFSWVLAFFAEKVILELKCTKITSLELLRTQILCLVQISKLWECEATDAQKLFLSQKKLLNAILRAKLNYMKNDFFLMKWTVFCNAEDRFSWVWAFFAEKVILGLNAQNHFFRASKNTNSVFSATKHIMRMWGTDAQKLLSQSEKVLNAILRAKLKYMKNVSF